MEAVPGEIIVACIICMTVLVGLSIQLLEKKQVTRTGRIVSVALATVSYATLVFASIKWHEHQYKNWQVMPVFSALLGFICTVLVFVQASKLPLTTRPTRTR